MLCFRRRHAAIAVITHFFFQFELSMDDFAQCQKSIDFFFVSMIIPHFRDGTVDKLHNPQRIQAVTNHAAE